MPISSPKKGLMLDRHNRGARGLIPPVRKKRARHFRGFGAVGLGLVLLVITMFPSPGAMADSSEPGAFGLDLGGSGSYVAFGDPDKLDLAEFTVEAWFKRTGSGVGGSTGTRGIPSFVPLVTHGAPQSDGNDADANWLFGIDGSTGVLAADLEEGAGGSSPGLNHPVFGTTVISYDIWHHAAATYDGTTWRLYLDGVLEATKVIGEPTRSDSRQHVALGAMLNTSGSPRNLAKFEGMLDEVRVWDRAVGDSELLANINVELTSAAGLVARWGMNEGGGVSVVDSVTNPADGVIRGTGSSWSTGAPFDIIITPPNRAPNFPTLLSPINGALDIDGSTDLQVQVSDPDGDDVTARVYGRSTNVEPGEDFTIVVLPDTQHYVDGDDERAATYSQQTQWIVDNVGALNVVFVSHLGDLTESFDAVELEWQRADAAMDILDSNGVPNNVAPGDHDLGVGGTTSNFFDQYFGPERYDLPQNPWYGGWLGQETGQVQRLNKDNYELFTAGGIDFLIVHLEIDPPGYAVDWANMIISRYPDRQVIVSTHAFLDAAGLRRSNSVTGRVGGLTPVQVWDRLVRPNCNIFFVMNGHYPGEAKKTDLNDCGNPVHQVLTDYQSRPNGGDGWLRYYTFRPSQNQIEAHTYSPKLAAFETDSSSQFSLPFDMSELGGFQVVGTSTSGSGDVVSVPWSGLDPNTTYEWRVVVDDGSVAVGSPVWSFSTVTAANGVPVFGEDLGDRSDVEGGVVSLLVSASDPDGDVLTFGASGLPPGLVIDPVSGLVSGTVGVGAAVGGPYSVELTVTDGMEFGVSDTFVWTVTDSTPPSSPAGLVAKASTDGLALSWASNNEPDLAGYRVFRSLTDDPGSFVELTTGVLAGTSFFDPNAPTQTPLFYAVTAVDEVGNSSTPASAQTARSVWFVGSTVSQNGGSSSYIDVDRPSGVEKDDLMVVVVTVTGNATISSPSGWLMASQMTSGKSLRQNFYYRLAGDSEPGTYRWNLGSVRGAAAIMTTYGGIDVSDPFVASSGGASNSSTIVSPSAPNSSDPALLVAAFGIANQFSISEPSGMIGRPQATVNRKGNKASVRVADEVISVGATGTRTASSTNSGANVGQALVFRPAPIIPPG